MTEHHAARKTRLWGVGTVALIAAIGLGVIAFNRSSPTGSSAAAVPITSSAEVESYAGLVQGAQKAYFAAQKQYASDLERLQIQPPTAGVVIDYRGSGPLGYCWLARTDNGVWYTISQRRVARSEVTVADPPPIACP